MCYRIRKGLRPRPPPSGCARARGRHTHLDANTILDKSVGSKVAAGSKDRNRLRRSADGVNSLRGETPNEEGSFTLHTTRNGFGTASSPDTPHTQPLNKNPRPIFHIPPSTLDDSPIFIIKSGLRISRTGYLVNSPRAPPYDIVNYTNKFWEVL